MKNLVIIMKLTEYMESEKMLIKTLAKKLMITPDYLGQIASGKRKPSKRLAKDIEKATKGKVKAVDLLKDKKNNVLP